MEYLELGAVYIVLYMSISTFGQTHNTANISKPMTTTIIYSADSINVTNTYDKTIKTTEKIISSETTIKNLGDDKIELVSSNSRAEDSSVEPPLANIDRTNSSTIIRQTKAIDINYVNDTKLKTNYSNITDHRNSFQVTTKDINNENKINNTNAKNTTENGSDKNMKIVTLEPQMHSIEAYNDTVLRFFWSDEEDKPEVATVNKKGKIRKKLAIQAAALNSHQNSLCSPVGAMLPIAKMAFGAKRGSTTEQQLLQGIGVLHRGELEYEMKKFLRTMSKLNGVQLDIASKIYISAFSKINNDFHRNVFRIFDSDCGRLDYKSPENSAAAVNTFVNSATRGMIKEIMKPSDFFGDPSIVIVNAIFFKGDWQQRFMDHTLKTFYGESGTRLLAMSGITTTFKYRKSEKLNAQMVQIPYIGNDVFFLLVLPSPRNGLRHTIQAMAGNDVLGSELKRMKLVRVTVVLPRIKYEVTHDMMKLYEKCHIRDIFSSSRSQLTEMVDNEKLYVTKAVHKAVIQISDTGTVGVMAPSAVLGGHGNGQSDPLIPEMVADHPFFFLIVAKSEPLFSGTYTGSEAF